MQLLILLRLKPSKILMPVSSLETWNLVISVIKTSLKPNKKSFDRFSASLVMEPLTTFFHSYFSLSLSLSLAFSSVETDFFGVQRSVDGIALMNSNVG